MIPELKRCPRCGWSGKLRSTGRFSQGNHLNGHVQQIAKETGNSFDAVKTWVKQEGILKGYPSESFRGKRIARSESTASVEECTILIDIVHDLANDLSIKLEEGWG